jgi:hypothetical protein
MGKDGKLFEEAGSKSLTTVSVPLRYCSVMLTNVSHATFNQQLPITIEAFFNSIEQSCHSAREGFREVCQPIKRLILLKTAVAPMK